MTPVHKLTSEMKNFLFVLICLGLISCQPAEEKSIEAQLVGEWLISSEYPEFATSVNEEQDLLVFNRTIPDRSKMWIMYTQRKGDMWIGPDTMPFSSGQYRDVDPFLAHDGKRLYFSSNRPISADSTAAGEFNTWYVERVGDAWSEPINPGYPLNSDSTEIFISMTQSGNAYFVSERGPGRIIMVSKYENGAYQKAKDIELKLRGELIYASNPCIASDESFLIVASRDPQGNGTPDLFVSWHEKGQWSELINLGEAVNSPYAEFAPGLSKDDQVLYFSSERPGLVPAQGAGVRPPGDIYRVDIQAVLKGLKAES
jgi:hypothetical protein